ncbi:MAG: FkbM family methyltransferase [Candidatus Hadarchaeota archaeon]
MKPTVEFMLNKLFAPFPESSLRYKIRLSYISFWCSLCRIFGKSFSAFHSFAPSFFKDYLREYIPRRGDIVVDGGAFEGGFTVIASLLVGDKGKVIAFEPDEANFKKLSDEIGRYQLKNIVTVKKGLWSKNTTLKFSEEHESTSTFFFEGGSKRGTIKPVQVVRLDDEIKKMGIKRVDFLKLDVEGAEIEVVEGAKEVLKKNDVHLAIASYHVVDGKQTYVKLEKILTGLGYKVKTVLGRAPHTYGCRGC